MESSGNLAASQKTPLLQEAKASHEPPGLTRAKRRWITVEPVLLLFICFQALVEPLTSQYVYSEVARSMNFSGNVPGAESNDNCTAPDRTSPQYQAQTAVQKASSRWMVGLGAAKTFPAILATVLLMGYCDRAGRKLPMVLPIVGATLRSVFSLLIALLQLDVGYLILACFMEGASGGLPAMLMSAYAFMADVTAMNKRTIRFLILNLCAVAGGSVGTLAGGYVIDNFGFLYAFAVTAGVCAVNFLYTFFFIPETIQRAPDTKVLSLDHIKQALEVYRTEDPTGGSRRAKLLLCLAVLFFANFGITGVVVSEVYYLLAMPFCWSSSLIGIYQALSMLVATLGTLVTTALCQKRVGDLVLMTAGCLSGMAFEIVFATATTSAVMFIRAASAGLALAEIISMFVASTANNAIYEATLDVYAGTVFLFVAACWALAAILAVIMPIGAKLWWRSPPGYIPVST